MMMMTLSTLHFVWIMVRGSGLAWGQATGYHPRPQVADGGTTFRYEG